MDNCDGDCLNELSSEYQPDEVRKFIEDQRELDFIIDKQKQQNLLAKTQECPLSWGDVWVDGKKMCQGYNISYGKCPKGYTSFGTECIFLDDDDKSRIERGTYELPTVTHYKRDPKTGEEIILVDPETGKGHKVPVVVRGKNQRLTLNKNDVIITIDEETKKETRNYGTKHVPNQTVTPNGLPITLEEARNRAGQGILGGLLSYD